MYLKNMLLFVGLCVLVTVVSTVSFATRKPVYTDEITDESE